MKYFTCIIFAFISIALFYKYALASKEVDFYLLQKQLNGQCSLKICPNYTINNQFNRMKRSTETVFRGHPKTREEIWAHNFLNESKSYDQTKSLIQLLYLITEKHLNACTPVILYDTYVEQGERLMLKELFKNFPVAYTHGSINEDDSIASPDMIVPEYHCFHFIVFLADVMRCGNVIGLQATSKVIVVARSSQWRVQEFLSSEKSRKFVNLLVIGQTLSDDVTLEAPYILYTHKLYTDGLGSSLPVVLTSWAHGKLTRPQVDIFPQKMMKGYAGHRFVIAAADQPPYVFRKRVTDDDGGNPRIVWDGIEYRIVTLLASRHNFSIEIVEPKNVSLGSGDAVSQEVASRRADMGMGGLYLTWERIKLLDMSTMHSEDCAVFISLTSTALPRYRAIMGPFHWHVWLAMTFTYLIGIFPLAFSDKHTLKHLWHNAGEVENMFWYVFGTFTNCFTFVGKNSWSKSKKITTRLLVGWYWVFTIIITSCYTGSIIAFVTLPIYPSTVDSVVELVNGFYRIGTLDHGGWPKWFLNSSDPSTNKLLKRLELVPDIESGLRNTTKAFFWPYAFLGSRAQLEYLVQSNFSTTESKRSVLHISNECFVPFGVSLAFPNESIYTQTINQAILRMSQSGLIDKIVDDVRWDMQRSSTGNLLSAATGKLKISLIDEKGLTLDDTQGMFLLLAAGFLIAAGALLSEWMGGCSKKCRSLITRKPTAVQNSRPSDALLVPTPNQPPFDSEEELKSYMCSNFSDSKQETSRDHSVSSNDSYNPFKVRSKQSRASSSSTLEGKLIEVEDSNILIHSEAEETKRASSTDLDKEINEIFGFTDDIKNDGNKI